MGTRRKGRELALQALYQMEITADSSEAQLRLLLERFESSAEAREFATSLVAAVRQQSAEVDRIIEAAAEHWRLERLSRIDLNVIRIAVVEMTSEPPLPVEIVINEAIEVARRFGTVESATFVNGVLDQVAVRLGLKLAAGDGGTGDEQ